MSIFETSITSDDKKYLLKIIFNYFGLLPHPPAAPKCMLFKGIDEHSFSLKVSQADPRAKCSDIGKQILKKRIQHQHEMAIRHISVINYILQINFPL